MGNPGTPVGVIYGDVSSTDFTMAVSDSGLKRLDYVEVEHNGARVLGQVDEVTRESHLSYEEALSGGSFEGQGRLSAHVRVIGFLDSRKRVQVPRTPFAAGGTVRAADESLIIGILGLEGRGQGAYLGHVKGLKVPVHVSLNTLAQKHLSVLAKTGAGKSYTVGVILEEFLAAKVPMVILDPHGEYGSLRHPNVQDKELDAMVKYGVKPRSFQKQIREFAIDTRLNPEGERLRLEGMNLEAREIVDILPAKLSGGQVGVLYQAVKDVTDHLPAYSIQDVIDAVARNKSSAKWNVLNALEALQSTGIFHVRGTPVKDLVKPGQCTIINLKGVSPDVHEIVAARLSTMLWQARKRNDVPPHLLVVEEAHNFCPERGVGNAVSGPVLRTVASEGRKFGMGLVIVSQRPAKIDKNVLSQCNTQVILKVTNPNDLKAIVASVEGITSETADEIQRLSVGVSMVAGGGLTQPVFVDVRPRMTRHGGESINVVGDKKSSGTAAVVAPDTVDPEPEPPAPLFVPETEPTPVSAPPAKTTPPTPTTPASPPTVPRQRAHPTPSPPAPAVQSHRAPREREPTMASPSTRAPTRADSMAAPAARAAAHAPPAETRPSPIPVKAPKWTKAELAAVQRVATRLGVVGSSEPKRTFALLQDLALRQGLPSDHLTRLYLDIAKGACLEDAPACIRCPLRDDCGYHRALQQQRQKERGGIRRLWRR